MKRLNITRKEQNSLNICIKKARTIFYSTVNMQLSFFLITIVIFIIAIIVVTKSRD
jgi:hypothetical protein